VCPLHLVISDRIGLNPTIHLLRKCLDGGTRKDEEGWDGIILI
jgi:hypothetical protein